jgi:hypothetical protein
MKTPSSNDATDARSEEILAAEVIRATKGLRFGQIVLTIHNSQVVQIDRTEKIRLEAFMLHDKGSGI